MANCVLCGQKLGMFDQVRIDFHNTKQSVCSDCANRLDNTVGPAREDLFRQILDSPYLENGEEIRGDIYAGKSCPVCGATLHRRLKDFSIGADGGGGLLTLLADTYVVDLYACPVCGTRHSPLIGCPQCAKRKAEQGQRPSGSEQAARSRKPPWEK